MRAIDLQKYLVSSGLFKIDENTTMVEIVDGSIYNRVPVTYKSNKVWPELNIRIYVEKFGKNERCVEFSMSGVNIFADYTLSELNLPTLVKELNKIFINEPKFHIWKNVQLRNYRINNLLNER